MSACCICVFGFRKCLVRSKTKTRRRCLWRRLLCSMYMGDTPLAWRRTGLAWRWSGKERRHPRAPRRDPHQQLDARLPIDNESALASQPVPPTTPPPSVYTPEGLRTVLRDTETTSSGAETELRGPACLRQPMRSPAGVWRRHWGLY